MASRYLALKQERHDLQAEAMGLDLSTDEAKARFAEIEGRIAAVDADLLMEERRREMERMAPAAPAAAPSITGIRDLSLEKPWGFDTFGLTMEQFAAKSPTAFLAATHPLHPTNRYQNAADGEFLQAVFLAAKGRGIDQRLTWEAAAQGAGEFIGADGGFLLPKPSADRLIMRMAGGEVLSRVQRDVLTVGNSIDINVINETSRATGSRHGAVQGYRLDEGTAPTASRPKFAQLGFKLHKYAALGYASDELLADASLVGRLIFDAFGDELRFMTEDDIINGTGTGMPQGILKAAALIPVSKETGQAAATFVYENVVKMWARCYARCRPNCVWFINQDVEPQLYTMSLAVGTGGCPVFLPQSGASVTPYATLFGRPVVPIEYAASLGTVGDVILADMSEYWFFDKGSPQQAVSIHVAFTTDEQAFRVTYRADGRCSWIAALTPYKGTGNTQSCCVALATRA